MSEDTRKLAGVWSFVGTIVLAVFVTWHYGMLQSVTSDLGLFFTFQLDAVRATPLEFKHLLLFALAVVLFELPATIAAAVLQKKLLGESGDHAVGDLLEKMKGGTWFKFFFIAVIFEEVVFRGIFVGLMPMIPGLHGSWAFYALLLVGNVLFALIHLSNFKKDQDKNPLRTLPQFVAGFFFGFAYAKGGLQAAILTHFVSNAMVFAFSKKQKFNWVDVAVFVSHVACMVIGWYGMSHDPREALTWIENARSGGLDHWAFWDYVALYFFVAGTVGVILDVLLYDRALVGTEEEKSAEEKAKEVKIHPVIAYPLGVILAMGLIYLAYWVTGMFSGVAYERVIYLTLFFGMCIRSNSGSSAARTFWGMLPTLCLSLLIVLNIGFWYGCLFLAVVGLLELPFRYLRKLDD
jgi:hypothetical protein